MPARSRPLPLSGWTVLSLRPRGQHDSLRAAAARAGARTLALSVLAIVPVAEIEAQRALAADLVVFTSPNAVRMAAALHPLRARRGQRWLAVGAGTRRALRRAGIAADAPRRMDSEGLLDLPALADLHGKTLGLITGQGGRGLLEPALRARGAQVVRADVYARVTVALTPARLAALELALRRPQRVLLALTSAEALAELRAQTALPGLRKVRVIVASGRLAQLAKAAGFDRVVIAASARPAAILGAAVAACG
ncbi:uroporphyrinogen-III synthase [Thermomonas sp.]|uniref:uroporphyrinogen-III synthase n=1 Tax=Thermomonas sp. TaxID=1971895 RepID=UPI002615F019|nr:uroporphyrinogen-III synthase [Thermomonas sp.]MCO5055537.1 uroporphyrinogen-III synthase [Thermomonas sp.]